MEKVLLKIRRQDQPKGESYWEEFQVAVQPEMSVARALEKIRENPVNTKGEATSPVVWEEGCNGLSCGSCLMLIDGRPAAACCTTLSGRGNVVRLEPLASFPLVRDLTVDRSRMEPKISSPFSEPLSSCTACGACLEVCPRYGSQKSFIGAYALVQATLANLLSSPKEKEERMKELIADGGIGDCGNVQNCQKACPEELPLIETIGALKREATLFAAKKIFGE